MSIIVVIRYHKKKEELPMKQIYADNYRQIGLKIAYYRKLRGLIQKALSLDSLFDIATVLNVAPHKFLAFDE